MIGLKSIATSIVHFFGFRSMPCKFMNDGKCWWWWRGYRKKSLSRSLYLKKKKTTFWRMDAPPKTNMLNAKMQVWNMIFLFRHVIFSFHVSFRVCVHSPQKRVIFLSSWLLVRRVATPTCPFLWKIWIPLFGGGQVPKNINSYVYIYIIYIYIYI